MQEKFTIKNRKNQNIVVLLEKSDPQRGLVFIMHGLGGFKEQPHVAVFTEAFKEKGYTVVRFDTTNSFGESDGNYEDATTTNYYEDLEDIIDWASNQEWYKEPFCLAGHSLGGISTTMYAERYPGKVKALAPISTVVSGKLSVETERHKEIAEEWEKTGWRITKSESTGKVKKLKWSHVEDRLKYDLLQKIHKLTMPVLLIVGDQDISTPPEHQKVLYDKLPGEKEMHIIKGADHNFRGPRYEESLQEIKQIFLNWIDKI